MSDRSAKKGPSRRSFLKGTAATVGAASLSLEACGERSRSDTEAPAPPAPPEADGPLFTAAEHAALAALAELVLPGSGAYGATRYIERTLTLFEHDPPRLYAGTVGSTDEWLPFDRVRERAWRLRLYGSGDVPYANEAVLGSVRGHRPIIREAARIAAESLARGDSASSVWNRLDDEFRDVFTDMVLEGSLGDPIYGGNRQQAAWLAFHFERPMLGYGGQAPRSHEHATASGDSGEGVDPLRLTTRIALWIMGFFSRRIA